jgi:hypothetical protein
MNQNDNKHWPTEWEFTEPDIVNNIEQEYPEMMQEYRRIMWHQYEVFCKKQTNYGPSNISLGSNLANPEDRKMSLIGLWFRMNDKIQRLKNLVVLGKKDVVGESEIDTFQDLSVYGIIAQIVANQKWCK